MKVRKYGWSAACTLLTIWSGLISCNKEGAPDCLKSAGTPTLVHRYLDSFSRIEIWDYIQVELVDTTAYFVEISAPRNLIAEIETSVNEGQLTLRNNNHCNWVRSFKNRITVRIGAPDISDIQHHGTGDVVSIGTLKTHYLKLEMRQAAGLISLDVEMDSIAILTHTGVCDKVITGNVSQVKIFEQGWGYTDARDLHAANAFVNNSSINNVYVFASDYLYTHIEYSGNVYYGGHPTGIDSDSMGEGQLIPLN